MLKPFSLNHKPKYDQEPDPLTNFVRVASAEVQLWDVGFRVQSTEWLSFPLEAFFFVIT